MPARRRTPLEQGRAALLGWSAEATKAETAVAVRFALEELSAQAPGNAVEVRVPGFGVTQCGQGPRHTRGTPPNVVELAARTWIELARGELSWEQAKAAGDVYTSGTRADLAEQLPLVH